MDNIYIGWPSISFGGGVPVGGYGSVSLYPDGRVSFAAHFHNSGAVPFDVSILFWVRSKTGTVFTFGNYGSMGGLFGHRDWDTAINVTNEQVKLAWPDLSNGWSGSGAAHSGLDLGALWNSVKDGIQGITAVVAVIGLL